MKHLPVEEKQGAERLVLRRGGDVQPDRQVREEFRDLALAHFYGVALSIVENESPDPRQILLLCPEAVPLCAENRPHLVEKLWGMRIGLRHGKKWNGVTLKPSFLGHRFG